MIIIMAPPAPLRRLPGLFRRWELAQVIEPGVDCRVEEAGMAADGTPLYAVYTVPCAASSADAECAS